jgi:hypothetical protein
VVYIVASEITALLPRAAGTITGSSVPLTIDEVASMAARISYDLDAAAAAAGYSVPVGTDNVAAYAQMREYAEMGLTWRVLRTIFPAEEAARMPLASEYAQAYRDALTALREGKLSLVGAGSDVGGGSRELARSFQTSHFGDESGAYASPTIELNTVF